MFEPYVRDSAGHYTCRIIGKEATQEHLQIIGQSIHTLLQELEAVYAQDTAYQVMERLFSDHFHCVEGKSKPKENKDYLSALCFAFLKSISSAKLLTFSFQRYRFSC